MSNKGKGKRLNEFQRTEIITKLSKPNPPSKRALAREYEVTEGAIRRTWDNREAIQKRSALMSEEARMHTFRASMGRFAELEDLLYLWIDRMRQANSPPSPSLVIVKAKQIAADLSISEDTFKASWQWLKRFKERRGLQKVLLQGEGTKVDKEALCLGLSATLTIMGPMPLEIVPVEQTEGLEVDEADQKVEKAASMDKDDQEVEKEGTSMDKDDQEVEKEGTNIDKCQEVDRENPREGVVDEEDREVDKEYPKVILENVDDSYAAASHEELPNNIENEEIDHNEATMPIENEVRFNGFGQLYDAVLNIEEQLLCIGARAEAGDAYDDVWNSFDSFKKKLTQVIMNSKCKKMQNMRQMTLHDMLK